VVVVVLFVVYRPSCYAHAGIGVGLSTARGSKLLCDSLSPVSLLGPFAAGLIGKQSVIH
jgi:hypothetical protein